MSESFETMRPRALSIIEKVSSGNLLIFCSQFKQSKVKTGRVMEHSREVKALAEINVRQASNA